MINETAHWNLDYPVEQDRSVNTMDEYYRTHIVQTATGGGISLEEVCRAVPLDRQNDRLLTIR